MEVDVVAGAHLKARAEAWRKSEVQAVDAVTHQVVYGGGDDHMGVSGASEQGAAATVIASQGIAGPDPGDIMLAGIDHAGQFFAPPAGDRAGAAHRIGAGEEILRIGIQVFACTGDPAQLRYLLRDSREIVCTV